MSIASTPRKLKIFFLTAEAEPFIKIGGLGDYAGSLPAAIKQLSNRNFEIDIRVALPFHKNINLQDFYPEKIDEIQINKKNGEEKGEVYRTQIEKITYYLIKQIRTYESDQNVYAVDPLIDGEKFVFFSLACLAFLDKVNWLPDIIHTNDWHTALAVHQLANNKKYTKNSKISTILVIHNLPFLGAGTEKVLDSYFINPFKAESLPEWAQHQPLPMGIGNADQIVTVSPSYAKEICTPEFGNGLEVFLSSKKEKIRGILNGVDTTTWDPTKDPLINTPFSKDDLSGKRKNKKHLLQQINLPIVENTPLLVSISRLDRQKGIDIIIKALSSMGRTPWQFIILGTGDKSLENACIELQEKYPENVRAIMRYDNSLAHQLFSAGDIFLMPSRYEPCGTSQMIAMRYGCVPVASAVGGLKDSIDNSTKKRTGFLFSKVDEQSLRQCLNKAIRMWLNKQEDWLSIQLRAMQEDFSWNQSAQEYVQLYHHLKKDK